MTDALRRAWFACLLAALLAAPGAWAGQDERNDEPPPQSAQEAATPLERALKPPPGRREVNVITDYLRKRLQDSPVFIRDTEITLKARSYYFDQEQPNGTIKEAWALGGSLDYKSGWLADHFRIGAELFTSQPLYAPEDRDGTLLLKPGQEGYTVLGQAYAQARFSDDELLTGGASEYSTPYVNRQFNRMTPNTFEGITLKGSFHGPLEGKRFDYLFGYLSKIKQRNSDQFIPMSQALGTADIYYGTYMAQALFSAWGTSVGVSEYYTAQNLNILYAEATSTPQLGSKVGVKLSAQFTDQRTVGGALSLGGTALSQNLGARATFSYRRALVTLAYSVTATDGAVKSPWGSNPSYTTAAIKNTNRAGEQAALVSGSYDFKELGFPGLSAVAVYAYAWNARLASGEQAANQHELDLEMGYRMTTGILKGLWLRLQRNGLLSVDDPEATKEWRVILNWEIPLI